MKKKLLALIMLTSSGLALADNNNLYVGVGAGAGWNNQVAPAAIFRLDGGYNFSQALAFEIGTTGITQSGQGTNQSMQYYDASLKGTVPMGNAAAFFVQLGGAYGSPGLAGGAMTTGFTNGSFQAGWNFLTGVGIQTNLTRQVSLNLTDLYYYGAPNPQGNTNALLAGVKYEF